MSRAGALVECETLTDPMLEGLRVNGNHPAGVIAVHPTGWKIPDVGRSHWMIEAIVPSWLRSYRREWVGADAVAGLIIWSVVTPQCVAYAQIAGLPPEAGLMAAPGAMLGYALLGRSTALVVSATTATSALSAAAVGPLAHGDAIKFAALSAALALVAAAVLAGAGLLRLGGVADLVPKTVMTGFLFGLGLTITVSQLPALFGVKAGSGNFGPRLVDLIGDLGSTHWATFAVGAASIVLLIVLKRFAPRVPGTLVVLALAIVTSAALHFSAHGIDVIGKLPSALPHPSVPHVSGQELLDLLPAAFGVVLVSTEAVGVARALASHQHESLDANRELLALGASNLLAGLSKGFVQSGGASQTAAAESAGGKSQLATVIAAGLILLTGAFLAPLFKDLPQATLSAIVIVAVSGFFRVDEIRRYAKLRRSALVMSLVALVGVLALGVLPGLLVAAGLSLIAVIHMLSRPTMGVLARDPGTGAWGRADRHPDWRRTSDMLAARVDGALFYGNSMHVKDGLLRLVKSSDPPPAAVVLELSESPDLDVQTVDMLEELIDELETVQIELRLASVHAPAIAVLERAGLTERLKLVATIDEGVARA
jgi:sulfate permease, SulP family